ncbi:alpha/beta fold hydrolase [Nonomuraea sp. B19D2]|uniref:alpha/beta fold hydrolase n=1 Tax=Nonomuraea sp. B19D2 TaxID=3159561 RepID=UPI0032DAAB80
MRRSPFSPRGWPRPPLWARSPGKAPSGSRARTRYRCASADQGPAARPPFGEDGPPPAEELGPRAGTRPQGRGGVRHCSLSPEARYPVAIQQNHAAARWVVEYGAEHGLDASRMAMAGDSVGGNMAAALTLTVKGEIPLTAQVLFYPVTDASFDTGSYRQFATGYFLRRDGMQWFWDQYTTSEQERAEIIASPLRATTEDLRGLPPALIITAEADVLRDESKAYADKLREAGVPVVAVRYQGIIHDFVMLNALRGTHAAEAAINQANASGRIPVVFVHGLWLLPSSWDRWAQVFAEAGFAPVTPGWPDAPDTVAEAKAHPEVFAHKTVGQVADHYEQLIAKLARRPLIVGHSFGGLLTQILAGRGLACAGVAIDPAPFQGVLPLPFSSLRAAAPVLTNPANIHRAVPLTY